MSSFRSGKVLACLISWSLHSVGGMEGDEKLVYDHISASSTEGESGSILQASAADSWLLLVFCRQESGPKH